MDPQYLLLEDFMGHRRTEIDCTLFNSVLIVGQMNGNPDDSNGVGKSTIFHAIEYALFGEVPSDTIDEIVRDNCDSCSVTFDFIIKEGKFRIVRVRRKRSKKSYLELHKFEDGDWQDISNKTPTETQGELFRLIKITRPAFRNSILFSQSDLTGLISEDSNKRQSILKEALGLFIYNKFEKLSLKKLAKIKDDVKSLRINISNMGDPGSDIDQNAARIISILDSIAQFEQTKSNQEALLYQKQKELWELQQLLSSDAMDIQTKISDIKDQIKQIETKIIIGTRTLNTKISELSSLSSELNSKNLVLTKLSQGYTVLSQESFRTTEDVEKDIKSLASVEIDGKSCIRTINIQIQELEKPMPEEGTCKYCKQQVSAEHRDECIRLAKEELIKLRRELAASEKKLQNCKNKKDSLELELSKIKSLSIKLANIETNIKSKKQEIQNDEKYLKQITILKNNLEQEVSNNNLQLEELRAREKNLLDSYNNISIDDINSKIEITKKVMTSIEKEINSMIGEISSGNTHIKILQERNKVLEQNKIKLQEEQKKLDTLIRNLETYQIVSKSFSSKGIPALIVNTILDDFQTETNRILSELKPGLEVQFSIAPDKKNDDEEPEDGADDIFNIFFKVYGIERSYKMISGGQRFYFAVALKLALSIIIQKRLGVDIKFLELDEVEQAFDKSGVDTYADIIKTLQNNFKVFVITHNDKLKEKFAHTIVVSFDPVNGAISRLVA